MSSVSKHCFGTRFITIVFFYLFSNMLLAEHELANECATIDLTATTDTNQTVIYELLSNNNSLIADHAYIDTSRRSAFLLPGKHSLKLRQWPLNDYSNYLATDEPSQRQILLAKVVNHNVLITVEPNFNYQFIPAKNNKQQTLVLEKTVQACNLQEHQGMLAKFEPLTSKVVHSVKLPQDLESRLYKVMDTISLKNSSAANHPSLNSNILPLKLMGNFGVTFDNGNDPANNELKILTVYPFSVANQLRLASGDVIVNLNNKVDLTTRDSPNNKFEYYINSLNIGDTIEVLVLRDNEKHLLTGEYLPTILPESHYQVMLSASDYKTTTNGCASLRRYITGIKKYKIISHNGQLLNDFYGRSSPSILKLAPGLHRFKAVYSPAAISYGAGNERRYSTSGDIAPRIRGGSKAGDGGVKGLLVARTGSINGWFNKTDSNKTRSIRRWFKGGGDSSGQAINSLDISLDPSTGEPMISFTIKVQQDNNYKLKIERAFNHQGLSTPKVLTTNITEADLACGRENVHSVLSPILPTQPLVNGQSLPQALQFEFDQLLLEIKTYYQAHGVTEGVIDVYREKKSSHSYGLLGKMVDFQGGYALLVKQVSENSMASNIGLKVGDKILEFNDHTFSNKKPKEFLDELAKLSNGQYYNLLIQRDDSKQNITAEYITKILPAFHLSVDMSSVVKAQQAIKTIIAG